MSERSRLRLVVLQVLVLSLLRHPARPALVPAGPRGATNYRKAAAENGTRADHHPGRPRHDPRRPRPPAGPQPHRAGRLDQPHRAAAPARRRPGAGRQGRQGHRQAVRRRSGTRPGCAARRARRRRRGASTARPTSRSRSPTRPTPQMALQIMERREDFPGVTAELTVGARVPAAARRQRRARARLPRPGHRRGAGRAQRGHAARGAQRARAAAHRPDRPHRPGARVRRRPARHARRQDPRRSTTRARSSARCPRPQPTPGNYLVTTIDAQVQAAAEKQLQGRDQAGPPRGDSNKGFAKYKADSGAVVVHGRAHRRHRRDGELPDATTRTSGSAASAPRTTSRSPARRPTTRTSPAPSRASSRRARRSR